nr:2307_t:CDS:10 [Entrophospora candida]
MEANPTSAETNNLREFKSIGITRLSLGVQSLNDNDLLKLGRDHNSKDAIKSLEIAKKIFKDNVSFDLIFGRNNQNVSNWIKELKLALELADNHLSIYELTIKPGTPIYKEYKLGKLKIPSSDKITDMYESTIQIAKEFGFKQYEVSNFYKNSKYSRHNFGYWNGLDYLGIGPGAHGRLYDMKNNKRLRTFRILYPEDWMKQCEDLGHGMRKSVEMDLKTIKEELIVFGLRTKLGIPKKRFNLHSDGEQLEDKRHATYYWTKIHDFNRNDQQSEKYINRDTKISRIKNYKELGILIVIKIIEMSIRLYYKMKRITYEFIEKEKENFIQDVLEANKDNEELQNLLRIRKFSTEMTNKIE